MGKAIVIEVTEHSGFQMHSLSNKVCSFQKTTAYMVLLASFI